MWKILAAVMVALLPLSAFAQNQPAQSTTAEAAVDSGLGQTLAITAGVVGGVIVVDLLTGGSLTYPLLSAVGLRQAAPAAVAAAPVFTPAIVEARQAGAVLGEMITPATEARDAAARRDIGYAALLGLGGLAGGWLVSHFSQ